ncbi:MAG: hypothetical protein GVY16_09220 [Planctomycetes bacterium]|jgi:galactokinase/mevalonate kinase-like predicted kinase|nr:hypothetical protein [Planctomycetota bacterium]
MFTPGQASDAQAAALRNRRRYSFAEMALLGDADAFNARRADIRREQIRCALHRTFGPESNFSAEDLAMILAGLDSAARADWTAALLSEAWWSVGREGGPIGAAFAFSRILHRLGSALAGIAPDPQATVGDCLPNLANGLKDALCDWLARTGIVPLAHLPLTDWASQLQAGAFSLMGRRIITSTPKHRQHPRNGLRSDEIVWGRAPARLDVGGGWTDTPPYALEHGGVVINAAVDLNGQPPIHCYARVIDEPVIRMSSIDLGKRIEVSTLEDLADYRSATGEFALAKAALVLSGFSPETADWHGATDLPDMLQRFGGGIELTTLAAIPKGSGLGTSSIVGSVILGTVRRLAGQQLSPRDIFHGVLRMEQALTTGGGWQDQIGGVIDSTKIITAEPGLIPDARIHYVPDEVLDPSANGGATLLYYTGVTRLAKNVLQQVVGGYLDRRRATMATLDRIRALPARTAEAMSRRDLAGFGAAVAEAWEQNKALDPNSTNDEVETILDRVAPHLYGAKLLGAGGGGFLLMICKSPEAAATLRADLERDPPNPRARFFDFSISRDGLAVTCC